MGYYLSKPIKEKSNDLKENDLFAVAVSEMQGWRRDMEDAHILTLTDRSHPETEKNITVFGVFDGHGGPAVSKWVARHFSQILRNSIDGVSEKFKQGKMRSRIDLPDDGIAIYAEALEDCFFSVDKGLGNPDCATELRVLQAACDRKKANDLAALGIAELKNEYLLNTIVRPLKWTISADECHASKLVDGDLTYEEIYLEEADKDAVNPPKEAMKAPYDPKNCGCTAIVALVQYDPTPHLIVANVGDSRALVIRAGMAMTMSQDHKPMQIREMIRIKSAGAFVTNGRVDGNLNLSRTLGDLTYKKDVKIPPREQRICALPDLTIIELKREDEFVVLACDGVWDVLNNQQCASLVTKIWNTEVAKLEEGEKENLFTKNVTVGNQIATEICKTIADKILDFCLADSPYDNQHCCGMGCDNMTILVARLTDSFRETLEPSDCDLEDEEELAQKVILYGTDQEKTNYSLTHVLTPENQNMFGHQKLQIR